MWKNILHKLGLYTRKEFRELERENLEYLGGLVAQQESERYDTDTSVGDPDDVSGDARKAYVARVASFHIDILDKKMLAMINKTREELEKADNPRDLDLILKGTINSYWCLRDWGEACVSEMISYREENKEETEFQELKDKL